MPGAGTLGGGANSGSGWRSPRTQARCRTDARQRHPGCRRWPVSDTRWRLRATGDTARDAHRDTAGARLACGSAQVS